MSGNEVHAQPQESLKRPPLTKGLLALITVSGGATAANMFYNQPLLEEMRCVISLLCF